jgi:iron complex outermembrane receptor protein
MRRRVFTSGALLALFCLAPLQAQTTTGTVRGRVLAGTTQQPVAGATVLIGTRGALTQTDGRYTITGVTAGAQTLRISMLGYAEASQAVNVTAGQIVEVPDISLNVQAVGLTELVVVGYGTQRAGTISGAVKQVTSTEFNPGRIVSPEVPRPDAIHSTS